MDTCIRLSDLEFLYQIFILDFYLKFSSMILISDFHLRPRFLSQLLISVFHLSFSSLNLVSNSCVRFSSQIVILDFHLRISSLILISWIYVNVLNDIRLVKRGSCFSAYLFTHICIILKLLSHF